MLPFLAVALSLPSVVYTVMLGVVMVYWVFVMVGATHVNLLGEGAADGALDGMADGAAHAAAHAALDGLADGAAHAAVDGAIEGAMHAGGHAALEGAEVDGADVGGDGPPGDAAHGGLAGMLASLRLRSAPATVVLSSLTLFSWLFCVMMVQAAIAWMPRGLFDASLVFAFLVAPVLALPMTSLVIRPLAPIFAPKKATTRQDLVGKVCTVRTGKVTDRFGEATLADGGAGLVLRVRVDTNDTKLARGDQAIIIGYDEDAQEFMVAPMDDVMKSRRL